MIYSEQFLIHLRSALNHLYDPYFLRSSPLVKLFGLSDGPDTPNALQRILNEGIAAMEPSSGSPSPAQERRGYELIMYRYVQQFGQDEVANQLGISVRHLRREQNAAIYRLGALLWERHRLGARPPDRSTLDLEEPPGLSAESPPDADLAWLKESPQDEATDLGQALPAVVDLTRPLAAGRGVRLDYRLAENLPAVDLPPVALRQILLNMLSVSVACTGSGLLAISARAEEPPAPEEEGSLRRRVLVEFACAGEQLPGPARAPNLDEQSDLDRARRIAALYGGRLELSFEAGRLSARLALPAVNMREVLVIDDQADFIQLVQRETVGTRFRVNGVRDPFEGLRQAQEHPPDIILLDVMMPRTDGWEILGRLRSHPRTARIPVIICTILAQEELARSLGAKGFLRKPVTRAGVLQALELV